MERAARRAAARGMLTAGACVRAGIPLASLPGLLDCEPEQAWAVALCLPPGGDWPPERWATALAAAFPDIAPERLRDLAVKISAGT